MSSGSAPNLALSRHKPPSRSCKECYRRKLKCDRAQTCSNCLRGCITCVYTNEPIRRDRKSKRRAQESVQDTTLVLQPHPGRLLAGKHGKSRLLRDTCWARPCIEVCILLKIHHNVHQINMIEAVSRFPWYSR